MDGEIAFFDALVENYLRVTYFRCFFYFRKNVELKLTFFGVIDY